MTKPDVKNCTEPTGNDQQLSQPGWKLKCPKFVTADSDILTIGGINLYGLWPEMRALAQISVRAN
jgi:hypothetical protein